MRPVTIILLVVALGIAGTTAYLAKRLLSNRDATTSVAAGPVGQTEILLASKDIPIGKMLVSGDMVWTHWPDEMLDPRYVVRDKSKDALKTFVGSTARTSMVKGEPIQSIRLFHQGDAGFLAGMLAPGMRAVGIAVKPHTSVGGFVLPGDRVDVVLSYAIKLGAVNALPISQSNLFKTASQTVIRDARVLGVDQTMTVGKAPASKVKSVTLEVTPEGAEILALTGTVGTLSLALRSLATPEEGAQPAYPKNTTDLATLEALRNALLGSGNVSQYQPVRPVAKPRVKPRSQPSNSSSVKIYRGGSVSNQRVSQ